MLETWREQENISIEIISQRTHHKGQLNIKKKKTKKAKFKRKNTQKLGMPGNAGELERSFTKENQQKTSKIFTETHKKHPKSEIKGQEVNSIDISCWLETWSRRRALPKKKFSQKKK